MSVRELLLDLSNETSCTEDFQIVSLEGSVKDELRSADKVRLFRKQLSELSNKVENLSIESSDLNNFATDVLQMNYRHIMQNAGLSSEVVSFESNDKNSELNFLSKEVNKAISNTAGLEDKILDFSPEGKILSFFRRDKSRFNGLLDDLKKLDDPTKKNESIELKHKSLVRFFWRNDRKIDNLEAEIKKEISIIIDAEKEIVKILDNLIDSLSKNKDGNELKPVTMKIFKEELLGNRKFGVQRTDKSTTHKKMEDIAPLLAMGFGLGYAGTMLAIVAAPLPGIALATTGLILTIGTDVLNREEESVSVKYGSFSSIRNEVSKLTQVFNHDRNEDKFSKADELLKKFDGGNKNNYKELLSALAEVQELIYEHSIWLVGQLKFILSRS